MRAIIVDRPGPPESMRWGEAPDPEPGPGEVLIEVAATALNRADAMQRAGGYPPPPGASEVLGLECAGHIAALGDGVAEAGEWRVGDEVCALLAGGGYAQRVVAPAEQLLPVPEGVPLTDAAGLPEAACTVWSTLCMPVPLSPDDTVLVHGGAGGVGSFAVGLAAALGCTVLATAGGPDRVAACRELGADIAFDHREVDLVEAVRGATGGRGVDAILDVVGAATLADNVRALADGGRLCVIGLQSGRRAELDLGALMARRGTVRATKLRDRPVRGRGSKAEIVAEVREHVWPLIAAGRLRPRTAVVAPIAELAAYHARSDAGTLPVGKIVFAVPRG